MLPRLARGEVVFAIGITERDPDSNNHNIRTSARKVGSRYVINGQKYWTTGFNRSEEVLLVARTGTD